jgi:zinc transport system substrate-binding protein
VLAAGTTLLATLLSAGCGATTHANAPVLTVVTSLYPLAQAATEVGGSQVRVVDLARPGVNPQTMRLSDSQVAAVHRAALVVDIGDGFQPSVEQAARGARKVVALLPALGGTDPYVWLDPALMERASTVLQQALDGLEPTAKSVFSNGREDLYTEAQSLDIDFQSTLSSCPGTTFVTSNNAFASAARRYGLVDRAVGTTSDPRGSQVQAAASAIRQSHTATVFAEPYVDSTLLHAAAQLTGVTVRSLDTFETPPATGSRAEVSYSNLMEIDLNALSGALRCPPPDQN